MQKKNRGRPIISEDGRRRKNMVLSLHPDLDKAIRDLAAEEKRPLAWTVTDLLVEALKARKRKVPRLN